MECYTCVDFLHLPYITIELKTLCFDEQNRLLWAVGWNSFACRSQMSRRLKKGTESVSETHSFTVNYCSKQDMTACINHQINAQFLYSLITPVTLYSSTCFEHRCGHLQEERTMYAYSIWYRHTL